MTRPVTKQCDEGFSLVEILIVIVVLGILGATTVFAVRGITDRGEEASCDADLRTVQTAVSYYLTTNRVDEIPATGPVDDDRFERTLVDAEIMSEVSGRYDVAADGSITVVDASCT